jgi:hypothetical protein
MRDGRHRVVRVVALATMFSFMVALSEVERMLLTIVCCGLESVCRHQGIGEALIPRDLVQDFDEAGRR